MTQQSANPQERNEDTYESLISLIENSQQQLAPIIVACDDWALRQRVIDRYESEAREAKIIPYRVILGREPSVRSALAKLKEENDYLQQGGEAVFTVTGAETLLRVKLKPEDEQSELDKFFGYLQWTREGLREFRYPIVLWVTYRILKEMSRRAPDFWSWRKAVLRFETETEDAIAPMLSVNRSATTTNSIEHPSDNFFPSLEELQTEIQQLESTSPDSPNLATLYDKLGQVYADRVRSGKAANLEQEREAAIEAFQKAIQQYQQLDRKSAQSAALTELGNFLNSQSKFRDAIELHQQSLDIARRIDDRQVESISLNNVANAYGALGKHQQAIEIYRQSLKISREIGDRQGEATSLNNLGLAYYALQQYPQAIDFHRQSLAIQHEIGERQMEAASLNNLGITYGLLEQYQQIIDLFQRALEISREIGNRQVEATSLNNLSFAYDALGQYQQAIKLCQQALEISREIGDQEGEAISLYNLGVAYYSIGCYQEGLGSLQEAKQLYVAIGLDRDVEECEAKINKINQIIAAESHA